MLCACSTRRARDLATSKRSTPNSNEASRSPHTGGDTVGVETPATIRKTSFNFVLCADGEVELECVYERGVGVEEGRASGDCDERGGEEEEEEEYESGCEHEDLIDADCEFEFNFDMMGCVGGSWGESGEEGGSSEEEDT